MQCSVCVFGGRSQALGSILSSTSSLSRVFLQQTRMSGKQFRTIMKGACSNPSAKSRDGIQFVLDFSSNGLEHHAGDVLGDLLKSPVRSVKNLILRCAALRSISVRVYCSRVALPCSSLS